jgi:hypothetical protein
MVIEASGIPNPLLSIAKPLIKNVGAGDAAKSALVMSELVSGLCLVMLVGVN